MHARTEGCNGFTWWLLAVFDLDESLVGTTSEVFRLLFGVFFLLYWGVLRSWEERFFRLHTE